MSTAKTIVKSLTLALMLSAGILHAGSSALARDGSRPLAQNQEGHAFGRSLGNNQLVQNFETRRNRDLSDQRVPLETVIAAIQSRCPGRLINARHDAGSNRYIVRWETSRQQIVSVQADAATGRILSTGGC